MVNPQQVSDQDVLAVFETLDDPCEPLATSEVADALGCPRRTAYEHLESLADRDLLSRKQIGARARAWWRCRGSDHHAREQSAAEPPLSLDLETLTQLISDEAVELVFRSDWLAQPFLDLCDRAVSFTVEGFVPLESTYLEYWTVQDVSGDIVRELPNQLPTTKTVRLLKSEGETHHLEVTAAERTLLSTVDKFDGTLVSGTLDDEVITIVTRFPVGIDSEAVLSELHETVVPDAELVSQRLVYTPRLLTALVEDRLTDTQWQTLQIAYFAGYYDVPRTSNGDVLADRMGITRQTFTYHRRHAEQTVFDTLFAAPGYKGNRESNR
jgi:predicted DNA binding protein